MMSRNLMEMLRRRGFIWGSFEIYGGIAGFFDYGPLGAMLRRNIEDLWRKYFVVEEGFYEIDTPLVGIEDVFVASGHVTEFIDILLQCKKCGAVFRADHYIEEKTGERIEPNIESVKRAIKDREIHCECENELEEPVEFNLMFRTSIGPGGKKTGYLRPETAQGIFINFQRLLNFYRNKLPFGVAQIGRAFRNEISPRQGVIRLREFNQAELEVFFHPADKKHPGFEKVEGEIASLVTKFGETIEISLGEAVESGIIDSPALAYFIGLTKKFLIDSGVDEKRLRFRQHGDEEKAHYASDCWDAEALTSYGWIEIVGIADRTDYDLRKHMEHSGKDLSVFIQYSEPVRKIKKKVIPRMEVIGPKFREKAGKIARSLESLDYRGESRIEINIDGEKIILTDEMFEVREEEELITGERIIPHVIEPSFGIDRIFYVILEHCYEEDVVDGEQRSVLRLKREMAPVKVAVLPLLGKREMVDVAMEIRDELKKEGIFSEMDDSGSIGRRYRRFDEIGTPFCITVDHETLRENTVTIRDRDSTSQIRVSREELVDILGELIHNERDLKDFGVVVRE